jgi:uncharacterized protein (TIGR02217 family)
MASLSDPFAPVRLNHAEIIEGTHGGPEFSTDITTNGGGFEQRNANWAYPLGRWDIGDRGYCQSTKDYLISFHRQRRGRYQAFLWRDLADYTATAQPLASKDGFSTQGWLIPDPSNAAQGLLVKRYTDGAYVAQRIITHPDLATLALPAGLEWDAVSYRVVSQSGAEQTLVTATPIDVTFDIPVRFDTEGIPVQLESTEGHEGDELFEAIWHVGSIPLVEIRL